MCIRDRDVGDPSNFVRILELFDKEFNQVKNKLSGYTIDDEETIKTIERVEKDYGYVLDPHGACLLYTSRCV